MLRLLCASGIPLHAQCHIMSVECMLVDDSSCCVGGHYVWGSVVYGYLLYDTTYLLVFYSQVGNPAFLVHHCLGPAVLRLWPLLAQVGALWHGHPGGQLLLQCSLDVRVQ